MSPKKKAKDKAKQAEEAQELLKRTRCISCRAYKKLSVVAVIDEEESLPFEWHHILLAKCEKCGCVVAERFDHDSGDWDDMWDQSEWYQLDKSDSERLLESLGSCPDPLSPDCNCAIDVSLYNSIQSLSTSWWYGPFESARHEHKVKLRWENGIPEFKPKRRKLEKEVEGET